MSSDPKERILVVEEAEKLFNTHLKNKKESYKRLGEKIMLKKGEVSMNFLSKEKLQAITSQLMRDSKSDKAFQAKVLTLLGSYYQKQADFQKAQDYFSRSGSLIIEEFGNAKHQKLVHLAFHVSDVLEQKHERKQAIQKVQDALTLATEIYQSDSTLAHAQLHSKLTHLWCEEKDEVETETHLKEMLKFMNASKELLD